MGELLHAEWYKLVHDRIYWILMVVIVLINLMILSGSKELGLPGCEILKGIMQKGIFTIMIASIYGGLFVGEDFEDRTLYHEVTAGGSRFHVLLAKTIVFEVALNGLILIFPVLSISFCSVTNGWGAPFTFWTAMNLIHIFVAVVLLNCAVGMISILAAVCFHDVGRTIGTPIALLFVMIFLLNSRYAMQFMYLIPVGMMSLVVSDMLSPTYGMILGIVWGMVLYGISAYIFKRAELR